MKRRVILRGLAALAASSRLAWSSPSNGEKLAAMAAHFDAYPARRVWHSQRPDANIDHRRVLNLETYFQRSGACLWRATTPTAGDAFPKTLKTGDIITWLLDARLPHIAVVSVPSTPTNNTQSQVVHNIGRGAEKTYLSEFHSHRGIGHYRWPAHS